MPGPRLARWSGSCLLLILAACGGGDDAEVDFGTEDIGEDRYSVLSESGEAKMGLTEEYVYFALSDRVLQEAQADMEEDMDTSGVAGAIGGMVRGAVSKAMGFRAKYRVDEIRDIRWEDGRMVIEFTDPDRRLGSSFQVDDEPATEAFGQAEVEAFAEEFRKLKRDRRGTPLATDSALQ